MRQKISVLMLAALLAMPAAALAGPVRISVSQFVVHPALDAVLRGFQDDLKAHHVDAVYLIHNAEGNMAIAGQIAKQIIGEHPDLILTIATPTSIAMAEALERAPGMQNTPMLFSAVTDPLKARLVDNLQHPGHNITGVSDLLPIDKHMANIRRFFPHFKTLGVIYNAGEANSVATLAQIKQSGKAMGFKVVEATVSKSSDVYQATQSLVGRVDVAFVPTDNTVVSALESAVTVCVKDHLPLFCADVDSVGRGAVAAMGFDYYKHGVQTGEMARRILNGEKPGDMPVETQKNLQLYINLKYAKKMGVTVPADVIASADKVYR